MQMNATMQAQVAQAKHILITTHSSPDADALGSSLALYHFLVQKEKKVTVLVPDKIPQFLKFLPGIEVVLIYDQNKEKIQELLPTIELVFCLDYNTLERVGAVKEALLAHAHLRYCMIDHHLNPSDFGQTYFGDAKRASTAELIYEWMLALGEMEALNKNIAINLYTGILSDTGNFRFAATSPRTHEIVAALLHYEIHHEQIHRELYDSNTENKLRLWGYATYEKMKIFNNYQLGFIALTKEELRHFNAQEGYLEGLANHILSIKNIKVALVLSEKDGKIKISFRSKGNFNVNALAAQFFEGGGHFNSAGGVCKESMDDTLDYLIHTVLPYYAKDLQNA